ncbi:MAG: UDP-N-acetylglucosamine 2-epimerase (non-hydrolyzing) [Candidatus Marinimicrobia bacterium]|nr:UDP-N-acetylglucosamine 2-epimerase (non-hydrolyzing) [Candidatus Neomarinimicrobiota bacterium]|tara:strand:+ start:36061 stop:37149 length:1089 start_codon:yes stop_codon:yes gene_type:complete
MKKIDLIVGARPNFIKAFPVYNALDKTKSFSLRLINTGQHYDKNMVEVFFNQLNMKNPDINLGIGSGRHGEQTGKLLQALEKEFISQEPDLVMVFGDVNSTLAAALAAAKLQIPLVHIEAGLRSFDRGMPEEINRVLTDQISDLLFITSPEAEENLLKENKKKNQIHFVGNTMIDSLVGYQHLFNCTKIKELYDLKEKKFILITLHRPSNVDDPVNLEKLIISLNKVAEYITCLWPVHPRTQQKMGSLSLKSHRKLIMIEPLGYFEFMGLQRDARAVVTDSGGVQEESTFLKVPCLTVRNNTERPITIKRGTNRLIGTKYSNIPLELKKVLAEKNISVVPKLWDGKSSDRIAQILIKHQIFN